MNERMKFFEPTHEYQLAKERMKYFRKAGFDLTGSVAGGTSSYWVFIIQKPKGSIVSQEELWRTEIFSIIVCVPKNN